MKSRRLALLLPLLLLHALTFSARTVTENEARRTAAAVIGRMGGQALLSYGATVSPAALTLRDAPRGYLLSAEDGRFALVAKDDGDAAVLGYGTTASCGKMPLALQALLASKASAYPPDGVTKWEAVPQLLTTARHQEAPYNCYSPYYTRDDGTVSEKRCVVGCVATAMEQIVTYYRRQVTLLDTLHGWETAHYKIDDVLPGETVDTRLILDNYDTEAYTEEEAEAVGRLSYYLGMAARMNWGESSSGANSTRLVEPLRRVFGYKYVRYIDSYKYAPADFWNLIASEIAARRPVYFAGAVMETNGHAFVIDGLDGDGFFHVNWGGAGQYDGYFRLDVLCPSQPASDRDNYVSSGYFCNQEAIVCCPDEVDAALPDTLARTGREIAVDAVTFPAQPMTGRLTEVKVRLRNTTSQALTTPFALLQNLPADTALFTQAQWLAMTSCTLAGGESAEVSLHARLTAAGKARLSITPDGLQTIWSETIDVTGGHSQDISVSVPEISFEDKTTAVVRVRLTNNSATERAAERFVYDVADEGSETGDTYTHYIYMPAGGSVTDEVGFPGLTPGKSYVLRVRKIWPAAQTLSFTVPGTQGVGAVSAENGDGKQDKAEWYDISGRRTPSPSRPGVYVTRHGKTRAAKVLR